MDRELYFVPGVGYFAPELLGITEADIRQQNVFNQVPSDDWLEEAIREKLKRDADK